MKGRFPMVDLHRPIKVGVIMGKMNAGGKKTLVMEYFKNINQSEVRFHFICDRDSKDVPEQEIIEHGGDLSYVAPYQSIINNMLDTYRICRNEQFDVLHAYNSTMNLFPMLVGKASGVPVRISESISMAHERELKTYVKKALRPASKLFATNYMACGEDCGRWQFGNALFDAKKVDIFKTAIDSDKNAYDRAIRMKARKSLGFEDDDFVLGFIGRFASQKNPLYIVEIFREVHDLRPHSKLLLVGDGPMKKDVFRMIAEYELDDFVSYMGLTEDITRFYQAMDCFLLPSLYEGLPVVGLEAQCAGLDVYFSTEVTKEASFCSLGHFLPLDKGAKWWAERILASSGSIPRTSHSLECKRAGFDSKSEASRLKDYYQFNLSQKARMTYA